MNSRTKETLVALRALRLWAAFRFPSCIARRDGMLVELFYRDDADAIIELALSENEDTSREEIRRELGNDVFDNIGTLHSTTLREAHGVDDEPAAD